MKGITHFLSGLAVASCLPGVVAQAAEGSFLFALAGACALLPDTLDFKLARFFEKADRVLGPTAGAGAMALALQTAAGTAAQGAPQTVRLLSQRAGFDRWLRYSVQLDVAGQALAVVIGPVVLGGGAPAPDAAWALPADTYARVALPLPLDYTYDAAIVTDVFAGPSLRFERAGDRLAVSFLPWHRAESHSLLLAAGGGLLAGLAWGPLAGAVAGLAFATHVLEDQLGAMGSNLFWPLTRRRLPGLGWLRSGDALPNFATVWTAVTVLLFNLWRYSEPQPALGWMFWGTLLLVPVALAVVYAWQRRPESRGAEKAREELEEGKGE